MKIVIIVPAYNEGRRAVETVGRILKVGDNEVIIVDDGSTDETFKLLKKQYAGHKKIHLLKHVLNLGKGAAMKTGVKMAQKLKAGAVIFVDADGQHNPLLIPRFEAILKNYDLVFGYRKLNKEMPFVRKWGNIIAKKIVGVLFNVNRREFLCGFMGFKLKIYPKIKWKSTRYGVETEIAAKVGRNKLGYQEIEIDTIYVDKYKGVSLIDAIKVLFKIPFWYFDKS